MSAARQCARRALGQTTPIAPAGRSKIAPQVAVAGPQWAASISTSWIIWVAIPWGLGLAFHALAFLVEGTRLVRRR